MKIENVPITKNARPSESVRKDLIEAMRKMEVGQSVVIEKCDSNIRTLVWVVNQVLQRKYGIRTQPDGKTRIGRID
jgi:hypothetical protein